MEHGCRKGSPNASQNDQPRTGTQKKSLGFVGALAASVTLQLTQAREGKGHEPASNAFDETPIQVLEKRNDKVQGKTQLQKNPHARRTLAWAAWIIAKPGGWDGYRTRAGSSRCVHTVATSGGKAAQQPAPSRDLNTTSSRNACWLLATNGQICQTAYAQRPMPFG